MKILVLESDKGVREIIREVLAAVKEFEVRCPDPNVISFKEIAALASEFKPGVSIMGWRYFGAPVLKHLKENSGQVWIYSGDSEPLIRKEGGGIADQIFSKFDIFPIRIRALLLELPAPRVASQSR